ncbi:adenylosuccinate lyase [Candidatus Peregrinibacteria bacterium]|nr:MAG: adenylosuccinate lyase [Candidatus Peregrinibacteria bacterium]
MHKTLSPLDGRYSEKVTELTEIFSEAGLIRSRIAVEVEWLIFVCNTLKLEGAGHLEKLEVESLRKLYIQFQDEFAEEVKELEKTTNHDVKAVEYFLQKALKVLGREDLVPFIHFACTSEDINNLAYAQMMKAGLNSVLLKSLEKVLAKLKELSETYRKVPMMAHTHGQPATPTTVGKEFKNIGARLFRQYEFLTKAEFFGKINGATGNFNAHLVAYPKVDWIAASKQFVEHLELTWQRYTTQIEPHDYMAEIFDAMRRVNTVLLDASRDLWSYIAMGYFKQKVIEGEVGSSTMPHKVNPIDFENAEGNLGLANALLTHFSEKLPISRMQRDLTDSTVLRNIGLAFGYSLLAYKSLLKGLDKLEVNETKLATDLDANWALLAEPIQTVLRRYGVKDAYEQLKALTRGTDVNQETIRSFVEGLTIPEDAKNRLLELTPSKYIGLAALL